MSTQTYSISDLSRELDITTRAIRFYEEQGLLSPERRGLERIYSARDKVSLKLILRGKRIGRNWGGFYRCAATRSAHRKSPSCGDFVGVFQRLVGSAA